MRFPLFLLVTVCVLGCQSLQQQNEAARERETRRNAVLVTDTQEQVSDCQRLTDVSVSPPFPLLNKAFPDLTSFGREEVTKSLRREALQAGGDAVLRTGLRDGQVRGIAYDCQGAVG